MKCFKGKMMKHHKIHCLNRKEKMCIAGMLCASFMRGMCIGFYLSEK